MGGGKGNSNSSQGRSVAAKGGAGGKGRPESESDSDEEGSETESEGDVVLFGIEAERREEGNDDADMGAVLSPFGPETFSDVQACWSHAASEHGFSLTALQAAIGPAWSDYHKMRLVNHLRTLGPEAARREAPGLTAASPIWASDELLQPVLPDDRLLFEGDDDEDWDDDEQDSAGHGAPRAPDLQGATSASGAPGALEAPSDLEEEVCRLRAELASARRLLTEADSEPASAGQLAAVDDVPTRARAAVLDPRIGAAFREMAISQPELLDGKAVLSANSGSGTLTCLCAKLGARTVIATETSSTAFALTAQMVSANDLQGNVTLIRAHADDELPALGSSGFEQPSGRGGGTTCSSAVYDVLVSERTICDLRLCHSFVSLLTARQRHLRPGGRVVPATVALRIVAVDLSAAANSQEAWDSGRSPPLLEGLSVSPLAPDVQPTSEAEMQEISAQRISSVAPAVIYNLDLASSALEDAMPVRAPFHLDLLPERCTTALALYLEVKLGEPGTDAGIISAAPSAEHPNSVDRPQQTVLHLSETAVSGAHRILRLPGNEFRSIDGQLSLDFGPSNRSLKIHVQQSVARHDAGTPLQIVADFSTS